MKILMLIDRLDEARGGTTRAVLDLAASLDNAGHHVEIVTTGKRESVVSRSGLTIRYFPRTWPRRYSASRPLSRWIRRNAGKFDVAEIHGVFHAVALQGARVLARAGTPFVFHAHGSLDPYDLRKHSLLKKLYGPTVLRAVLARGRCMLFTSSRESENAVTFGSRIPRACVSLPVIPADLAGDRLGMRDQLALERDCCLLLFLGRIDPKKGIERLLDSLVMVDGRWHLAIAGSGDQGYVNQVMEKANCAPFTGSVSWLGHVAGELKSNVFAAADVFVLPSQNENFGIAVVEAAQNGLPLVLSEDIYIASDFFEAGAALSSGASASELASTLRAVVSDESLRRRMAQAARRVAAGSFSAQVATRCHIETLEKRCLP